MSEEMICPACGKPTLIDIGIVGVNRVNPDCPDFTKLGQSMGVRSPSVAPDDGSAAGSGTGGLTAPPSGSTNVACEGVRSHDWKYYCQQCGAPYPGAFFGDIHAPIDQTKGAPRWPPAIAAEPKDLLDKIDTIARSCDGNYQWAINKIGGMLADFSLERDPPCHVDLTGKTREPPHCPTCDCGSVLTSEADTGSVVDQLLFLQLGFHANAGNEGFRPKAETIQRWAKILVIARDQLTRFHSSLQWIANLRVTSPSPLGALHGAGMAHAFGIASEAARKALSGNSIAEPPRIPARRFDTDSHQGLYTEQSAPNLGCDHDLDSPTKTLKATFAPHFGWRCTVCEGEWYPEKPNV